jgi:L-arabinonolactonase
MGFKSGLAWFDQDTGAVQKICDFEEGLDTRANDGKCDGAGNWVIGGYSNNHRDDKLNITGLWRLNAKDMSFEEILDYRFRCSNTIAFSPDRGSMYFCDTPTREIHKFKYSSSGKLSQKSLHWRMAPKDQGGPDGATVDAQGGLWEAHAGNWKVVRHSPEDGSVDYEVKLPLNNPTSCAIGGRDMDTLFITTARHRLSEEERAEQPGAGQLWAVKLPDGIKGLPEPTFGAPSPLNPNPPPPPPQPDKGPKKPFKRSTSKQLVPGCLDWKAPNSVVEAELE